MIHVSEVIKTNTEGKKKTPKPKIDMSTVGLNEFQGMRKKYFKWSGEGKERKAFCQAPAKTPDGKDRLCQKEFSDPSSDTQNKHLAHHVLLPEFNGKKLIQGNLNDLIKANSPEFQFRNIALSFVVNNNLSWNVLESPEWKTLVISHVGTDPFASHAAKTLMKEHTKKGRLKLKLLLEKAVAYSISEDEGTVDSGTKVLQNVHVCDVDLVIKSYVLKYIDTVNKEAVTLIGHWEKTMDAFNLVKKKISAFGSDQALECVPRGMSIIHIPCATHLLDLSLEDVYIFIREEVEKLTTIRQLLTIKNNETQYHKQQVLKHLPEQCFPITALVRFVTHQQPFTHASKYHEVINLTLELLKNPTLMLKESEIETIKSCVPVFEIVHAGMKATQMTDAHLANYLPIMYGIMHQLDLLGKTDKRFIARSGQELFRQGVYDAIKLRIESSQLNESQRDLMIRSIMMDPYFKSKIATIFPSITSRTSMIARCRKALEAELKEIVRDVRDKQIVIDEESSEEEPPPTAPKKKKKVQKDVDLFAYLADEPTGDEDCPLAKDPEILWFSDYLKNDQGIGSASSSKTFWLEKKVKVPSCFVLVQSYRSILCTSIFEEQTFSQINRIVTEDRASLKDETVEDMLFFKKNKSLIFETEK
jgi:hypothetical protein